MLPNKEEEVLSIVGNFITQLRKCRQNKNLSQAQRLHGCLCEQQLLDTHGVLGNYLVPVLVECGGLLDAHHVFDRLPHPNQHSWTSLISGYINCGDVDRAFCLYYDMQRFPVQPNSYTFVALIKASARLKDAERGQTLHSHVAAYALDNDLYIGNTLVDMYCKCGSIAEAQDVFNKLSIRDGVSWNALITGYVECGHGEEALSCLDHMQMDGVFPSDITFICSLKACGILRASDRGRLLVAQIVKVGLEKDVFICSSMVDMYAKCGFLADAQEVFDQLPGKNVVSWTALLAGYVEHGFGKEALDRFKEMQLRGVFPDAFTYACALKACTILRLLETGQSLHTEITIVGVETERYIGNKLVDMYVKCGSHVDSQKVFDCLRVQDVVAWDALISGYAEEGLADDVLKCFEKMHLADLTLDTIMFVCCVKACDTTGARKASHELHAEIVKKGLEREVSIGSKLMDMYFGCGLHAEACKVFNWFSVRNVALWVGLIAGYNELGLSREAVNCLQLMELEGISPDLATFVYSLKASASIGAVKSGSEVHADVVFRGLERELNVGSSLVDIYAKCGLLANAQEVFPGLLVRDAVSWATLITGCTEHGLGAEAGVCLEHMQQDGISPDSVMYVCTLKACGSTRTLEVYREVHADLTIQGVETELLVANTLVDTYIKCGSVIEARKLFDRQQGQDIVTWNALLAGYAEYGLDEELLNCFKKMQLQNISADAITYTLCLKVCGNLGALETGGGIHAAIRDWGAEGNLSLGNILIDMYGKCGLVLEARAALKQNHIRDVLLWTALMMGFAEQGLHEEVLACLVQMVMEEIYPDAVTFICSLKACSCIGDIDKGREIHVDIIKKGLKTDPLIGNTLVGLYAKCGLLVETQ